MTLPNLNQFRRSRICRSFHLTPVIDIVFLLIIFFMVVSHFIKAENFNVNVPDNCNFAREEQTKKEKVTTVSVIKTENEKSIFAVDSEQITDFDYNRLAGQIARLLDERLQNVSSQRKVVTLRIDKQIPFAEAQFALDGIARSCATDIKLAALKKKNNVNR